MRASESPGIAGRRYLAVHQAAEDVSLTLHRLLTPARVAPQRAREVVLLMFPVPGHHTP
jgi:hypothetical protein